MSDAACSYDFAIAVLREKNIRSGRILPCSYNPEECRWAKEGPLEDRDLDTVRREAVRAAA